MVQEVSAVLLRIGVPHLVEYVTPDGLFSVDIALRNGAQVCSVFNTLAPCCATDIPHPPSEWFGR